MLEIFCINANPFHLIIVVLCLASVHCACRCPFRTIIITITIFSNLIDALTALVFTNYCVGLE